MRSRIGLTGQYAAVDEYLTGRENLEMFGRLYHLPKKEVRRRANDLLERFDLVDAASRLVKTYVGKESGTRLSRADVADFMLKQTTDDTYLHQSPVVSY